METLLASILSAFVPLALLWVGWALMTGQSLDPGTVLPKYFRLIFRLLRWLWKERPPRGGPGRIRRPRARYRNRR